jgi:NACHT domain
MCLRGTRSATLARITKWALQGASPNSFGARIFWLHGVAGAGKSTIAHTIAHDLDKRSVLGSCFFFMRGTTDRDDPTKLIGSMARELSVMSPILLQAISTVIREKDGMGALDVHRQFSPLVTQPFLELAKATPTSGLKPIVIIWDALDECGDHTSRHMLLQTLKEEIPRLPSFVRFLITSRPTADIASCMDALGAQKCGLELRDATTHADINSFLTYHFRDVTQAHQLPEGWPGISEIEKLTQKSAGLFIWANTVSLFIQNSFDPAQTLHAILNGTSQKGGPEQDLDHLYFIALRCAGPGARFHGEDFHRAFQAVVGAITVLKVPMAIAPMEQLCGAVGADKMVRNLGSVIRFDFYDSLGTMEETVQFIHPSFREFITSAHRSGEFFVDQEVHNSRLARCCLTIMHLLLKRDICHLKDPSKLNLEVQDFPERMDACVPVVLRYACCFWIEHVCSSSPGGIEWLELLEKFFTEKVLNWIEVLSLMGKLETIQLPLERLYTWLKVRFTRAISEFH